MTSSNKHVLSKLYSKLTPYVGVMIALGLGFGWGRQILKKRVEVSKTATINGIVHTARAKLKAKTAEFVARSALSFLARSVFKLAILLILYILHVTDILPLQLFFVFSTLFLLSSFAYDLIRIFPTARYFSTQFMQHRWNPLRFLEEMIALEVINQVMIEAKLRKATWWEKVSLFYTGYKQEALVEEIALAAAELTKRASLKDVWPFAVLGIVKALSIMALYTFTVYLIFTRV